MRSPCRCVCALALALALAACGAQAAMRAMPPGIADFAEAALAPAPSFNRGEKFRLPQRPETWTLAATSATVGPPKDNEDALIGAIRAELAAAPVAAPAAAEQAAAPALGPKYQLPQRPGSGNFASTLSAVTAIRSFLAAAPADAGQAAAPGLGAKYELPQRPTNEDLSTTLGALLADYEGHPMDMPQQSASSFASAEAATPAAGPGSFPRDPRLVLPPRPTEEWRPANLSSREEQASTGFVSAVGTNFVLDGKIIEFAGTNGYFLILRCQPNHACNLKSAFPC